MFTQNNVELYVNPKKTILVDVTDSYTDKTGVSFRHLLRHLLHLLRNSASASVVSTLKSVCLCNIMFGLGFLGGTK
jgi:hypothetical protein